MSLFLKVLLIVLVVLVVACVVLFIFGRKAQRKQAAQKEQMDAVAQNVTILVIDKKKMKLKDAGLPAAVLEQTPKLMRNTKLPIVKAKIGPRVMSLICESAIYDSIPIKKEVKAVVSGLYITSVKGMRGQLEQKKKKQGIFRRLRKKAENTLEEENRKKTNKKSKK